VTRTTRPARRPGAGEHRNGDIKSVVLGDDVKSTPQLPHAWLRPEPYDGSLPLVTRTEIALREYARIPSPRTRRRVLGVRHRALATAAPSPARIAYHPAELLGCTPRSRNPTTPDGAVLIESARALRRRSAAHSRRALIRQME